MHGCRTTLASQPSSRWHEAWPVNSAQKRFALIRCLRDIYIRRTSTLHGFYVRTLTTIMPWLSMTAQYLDAQPHLLEKWSNLNPLGRIGRPDELRGVIAWLASDASSFCTGSE